MDETSLTLADLLKVIVPIVLVIVGSWFSHIRRLDKVRGIVDVLKTDVSVMKTDRVSRELCDLKHDGLNEKMDIVVESQHIIHAAWVKNGIVQNPPEMPEIPNDLQRVREESEKDVC